MEKPLILLTNDDGINSPYLITMAEALQEGLGADVLTLAPERQRSAMSHTITLHKPLRVQEVRPRSFAVSGSPVDCVYVGALLIADRRPSLVVSGPNDGFNLGTDVFYSGTVGAAVEGGLRGIPSIAVSVERNSAHVVGDACKLVCSVAKALLGDKREIPPVLNINVPHSAEGRVRWTKLGKRFYADDVAERKDPRGNSYYWVGGGIAGIADIEGSDCEAVVSQGIASITPLRNDLTQDALLGNHQPAWTLGEFQLA
jgi:5'-nucleotidase